MTDSLQTSACDWGLSRDALVVAIPRGRPGAAKSAPIPR